MGWKIEPSQNSTRDFDAFIRNRPTLTETHSESVRDGTGTVRQPLMFEPERAVLDATCPTAAHAYDADISVADADEALSTVDTRAVKRFKLVLSELMEVF
jgi:hypothetical protein